MAHPIQVTGSTYCQIVFQIIHFQRYIRNLEENWKTSVCIGVKNFANP